MSNTENCKGCKAFFQSEWRYNCELGYEIAAVSKGKRWSFFPVYKCPKPRTLKEFFDAPKAYAAQEGAGNGNTN